MPEWFQESFNHAADIPPLILVGRLAAAFLFGCAIAFIYWATHRPEKKPAPTFTASLVLLTILIAVVEQVIGNNFARAFSLVGVLGIVRFRTLVEDTRDTAFVIFAVITGMALGVGYLTVAGVGLGVVGFAAAVLRPWRSAAPPVSAGGYVLTLRVGLGVPTESVVDAGVARSVTKCQLIEAATSRQGAALDLTYEVQLRPDVQPVAFVSELNQVQGVQNVELRRR
jgi:hypothetical protein